MMHFITLETVAVVLSIAYLLLAMRQNSLCWYCAFFSTAIFTWIFGDVNLYMESALNIYYMVMAVYGWYQWQRGGDTHHGITIHRWPLKNHLLAIIAITIITVVSGYLLSNKTDAHLPYLDSFTTWASVLTTWMVARKILENWLYWIVIDTVSIYLYLDRGLYQTLGLFVIYTLLAAVAYFSWQRQYLKQAHNE